jgi:hypothetical protein
MTTCGCVASPKRHTVSEAIAWLDAQLHPLTAESVPLQIAAVASWLLPSSANFDVPGFDRATMDGYAVSPIAPKVRAPTPGFPHRRRRFNAWLSIRRRRLFR